MDDIVQYLHQASQSNSLPSWLLPIGVFLAVIPLGIWVRKIGWKSLEKLTHKTNRSWDNILLSALSIPFSIFVFVIAFGIAIQTAPPLVRNHPLVNFGFKVSLIVVSFWFLERTLSVLFRSDLMPNSVSSTSRSLLVTVSRVLVISIGCLIILDTIGVSITPLLASLGVGSVAVALALQDTLSNFFGGIYLLVDRPIRIGDFVQVDDIDGYVDKIGWRSTRIKQLANNTIVVPNSKIASARLKNFDLPESEGSLVIQVGVSYSCNLEHVERVTIEVARKVLRTVPGGVSQFDPFIRYHTFGDSSIGFSVILRVQTYVDNFLLKHEFIKALHAAYNEEKIEIPFPQRVVHMVSAADAPRASID